MKFCSTDGSASSMFTKMKLTENLIDMILICWFLVELFDHLLNKDIFNISLPVKFIPL